MELNDIAEIRTGLVIARKKAEFGEGNRYKVLTLKSFDEDGWVDIDELDVFESVEELSRHYLTQKNDVVIRLSYPHTAVCIDENLEGIILPSLFSVIRLFEKKILPEFLALYLNSDRIKRKIAQAAAGSAVTVIKTSFLKELSIRAYPMEMQRKAIQIHKLHVKEKKLLVELAEKKEIIYKSVIKELTK